MIVSQVMPDIPAFYGDWLIRRLAVGTCRLVSQQAKPMKFRFARQMLTVSFSGRGTPYRLGGNYQIGLHAILRTIHGDGLP